MIKKIQHKQSLCLKDQIEIRTNEVVSKTLCQNEAVSMTLFAFDEQEEIATHASQGDAMVSILQGKARITISDVVYEVKDGETIIMSAGEPHALYALEPFKMMLTVVFPLT